MVIAAVWKNATLGLAFMEGTTLRFCQVADGAPEFRQLQAIKYQCKPDVFVIPSTSDALWTKALKAPVLHVQGGAGCQEDDEEDEGAGDHNAMGFDGNDDLGEGANGSTADGTPEVVVLKNRDFSPQNAARRLSLLRTLADLPGAELKEQEMLLYLEHMLPREQDHARRAIAGLLAYLQRSGDAACAPPAVTCLRRYSLESQLYMAPECFLSLGVFADDSHPSAHGGRAKEGFSIWSLFCRTRSKPGERTLRSWFARPTQDLATLRERHGFIAHLCDRQSLQLLPLLHETVGQVKDVSKLEASLSRGGLLLSDFSAVLLTSHAAVKAKELLTNAQVPTELPAIARAHAAINPELYTIVNTVASVIDFEASSSASRLCPGAAKHISVRAGVHAELDRMRDEYHAIEPLLTELAAGERDRLDTLRMLPPGGSLYLVYVPQLGFLEKLPVGGPGSGGSEDDGSFCDEERAAAQAAYAERAGLTYQFEADG